MWNFLQDIERSSRMLAEMEKHGLKLVDGRVLLTLMADLIPEAGEVTTSRGIAEMASMLKLSYDQVNRSMTRLRAAGMVGRVQLVKRAGETALTTLLPAAFDALGFAEPSDGAGRQRIPAELSGLLCGQAWDVIKEITEAWHDRRTMDASATSDFRGGHYDRILAILMARQEEAGVEMEAAVAEAMELEELKAQGFELVNTADGVIKVNRETFERLAPAKVGWSFVKDVLDTLYQRDPKLLTLSNLQDRIAEAAYARASLPFVRDKAYQDGVRLLARQMELRWEKPRKIWPSWYVAADRAIHRPAVSA